jgi:transposase
MDEVLGCDFRVAADDTLYRCLDHLLEHKTALFDHLTQRWKDLFGAKYEVLLYDLTSTYFESDPVFDENDKRKFGYSRDKRPDCVQVIIALVVTPEGFPMAYEVMAGNTSDRTTLRGFLEKIERQFGKADRIWVMDRGIPTEKVLEEMRNSSTPISYLVGTPKGRLRKFESNLLDQEWKHVQEGVEVKLLAREGEVYVLAKSRDRISKERSMRKRQLKTLWRRLKELQKMRLTRDQLLLKLGAAQNQSRAAWRLVSVSIEGIDPKQPNLVVKLLKDRIRDIRRREGRYLLRTNLVGKDPSELWKLYVQLTQVEEAFKNLKGDLSIRPIYHQRMDRIEAHIFVAFLAYCLHVTLRRQLHGHAPGLTPRSAIEKFKTLQMIDVHIPTTDNRLVILPRYTQPCNEVKLLLHRLGWSLPQQPRPRISACGMTVL